MTTMDSDSESQDSDEGRRFRFEATRKDSNPDLQSRNRKPSPFHSRRSRSRDRLRRDRKDEQHRPRSHERRKDSRSSRCDERRVGSKDRKFQKENESKRKEDVPRHKDSNRDSKVSSHKDSQRRDSRSRDVRDSRSREDKRRRSREISYERTRSREKRDNKQQCSRERDEKSSNRMLKLNKTSPMHTEINEKIENQECKDLNLSDFDIVSDTEGIHSDVSDTAVDNSTDFKVKQQRNGDASPGPSNSNPDALSDFLLGNRLAPVCSSDTIIQYTKNCTDANLSIATRSIRTRNSEDDDDDDDDDCYGPVLPPKNTKTEETQQRIIGPCMPDDFRKLIAQDDDNDDDDDDVDAFGPALPPHLQRIKSEESIAIGPMLPETSRVEMEIGEIDDDDDGDDDGGMGPLPADHPSFRSDKIQQQLEYRARLIKKELAEIDSIEEKKREEWMTELPSVQAANLGLGPRKFRSREGPDMSDKARSGWTETPADRERKTRELAMGKRPVEEVEIQAPVKSNKRHEKSLLELHQKKMHKKKKKEEKEAGKKIRRPFDRDLDLQVNRFDASRKKNLLMKANALDDRFASGNI